MGTGKPAGRVGLGFKALGRPMGRVWVEAVRHGARRVHYEAYPQRPIASTPPGIPGVHRR
jgi:hypothetical protein